MKANCSLLRIKLHLGNICHVYICLKHSLVSIFPFLLFAAMHRMVAQNAEDSLCPLIWVQGYYSSLIMHMYVLQATGQSTNQCVMNMHRPFVCPLWNGWACKSGDPSEFWWECMSPPLLLTTKKFLTQTHLYHAVIIYYNHSKSTTIALLTNKQRKN